MANVEVQPVLERDVVGLGPILGVHTRNPLSGGCVDRGAGLGHRRAPPSPNRCMAWSARYSASPPAARRYRTDRQNGVEGKGVSVRVDLGGRGSIKKKKKQ